MGRGAFVGRSNASGQTRFSLARPCVVGFSRTPRLERRGREAGRCARSILGSRDSPAGDGLGCPSSDGE